MIFKVTEEKLFNGESGEYTVFGIEVRDENTDKLVHKVSDLFLYADTTHKLAKLLNEQQPEPIHFEELWQNAVEEESVVSRF